MKHTEKELLLIKEEVSRMWHLVLSQLTKAHQAFCNQDHELAHEILRREKRVDVFELKIDSDCENYIALYAPVAVDLRLVLSLIKISHTLERIGDFAEGIAHYILSQDRLHPIPTELVEELRIGHIFDTLLGMLSDSFVALEREDTSLAGKIIARDNEVDKLYKRSLDTLTEYLQLYPSYIRQGLQLYLLIRKLERIGDHASNIVEEIVFYVDAKVLKHHTHE